MVPTINHWLGQPDVIARFKVALEASWNDTSRLPHMLLVGPPGVGKTEIAHLAAREMGVEIHERIAQTITSPGMLNALLLAAEDKDIVFIDEIHELQTYIQTTLYRAMENGQVFVRGRGENTLNMPTRDITINGERFDPSRVTVRDVADFREHLSRVRRQAVSTVNRALVSVRRLLTHLVRSGDLPANPAEAVKELRRMPSVPKGLTSAQVRKVMREVELRGDTRATAVMSVMFFCGLRVSDVVGLELNDVEMSPRSGQLTCRWGKGSKLRIVPLPLEARRAMSKYLDIRPPSQSRKLFLGERGPLTEDGVRAICAKYSACSGVFFTPHVLRHTFAHRFLDQGGDLASLAQILGHENLNTTSIYTCRSQEELGRLTEELRYE